ncbi:MAG: hypothetical protein MJA27_19700 [Pseudanabaenales cyanobacterium]|nr:hypothetical protein [Pseudanabaenales cyanobacterium]
MDTATYPRLLMPPSQLLSEHSEVDIHLNTSEERIFGVLSNSPERLRVAHLTVEFRGNAKALHYY